MTIQQKPTVSIEHLHGRWLLLARAAWVVLVLFLLGMFIASLPASFATFKMLCSDQTCIDLAGQLTAGDVQALQKLGLSLDAYAYYWLILSTTVGLIWYMVGSVLAWSKSNDWPVLLVALMLVITGTGFITDNLLFNASIWQLPENYVYALKSLIILYTLALFPNGRFVPRWTGWIPLVYPMVIIYYIVFLQQLHLSGWSLYRNPLNAIAWFGCEGVLVVAQLYRYFRVSNQIERQQTKWVAFSFLVFLIADFGATAVSNLLSIQQIGLLYVLILSIFTCFSLVLPLSIGIATLRYRLWDIDIIINRTLVYGLLVGTLAAVYASLVIGLQSLIGAITGPSQESPLVIVASTLAIVILFQPLRQRIQIIIDHRFYRHKYDATRTLEAFSATLQNEVELTQLGEQLLAVVNETMQPTQVSLWLRPPQWQKEDQPHRLEAHALGPPSTVSTEQQGTLPQGR